MLKLLMAFCFLFSINAEASTPRNDSFRLHSNGTEPTGLAKEFADDIDFKYYGLLNPARQAMIDAMVTQHVSNAGQPDTPLITILIGAPGSGKSFAVDYLRQKGFFNNSQSGLISADQFKEDIPEYRNLLKTSPETAAPYVHRESLYAYDLAVLKAIKEGRSIILDGANSHIQTLEMIVRRARESGYGFRVELVRVQSTVETSLRRARARFGESGRSVPEDDIIAKSELTRSVFARLAPQVDSHVTLSNDSGIFISHSSDNSTRATHKKPIDVVVDLDWTLIYELPTRPDTMNDPDVFEFKGKYFRYSNYAREYLVALHNDPRFRVSFYSGGDRERVEFTLKNLNLRPDLTAFDIAFQVLNFGSLDEADRTAKEFPKRYKKNLRRIIESIDFDRAVLVDDIAHFLLHGQERAMLWLGKTYKYFATLADVKKARALNPTDPYIPSEKDNDKGQTAHELELNKLVYALGVIMEAADAALRTGQTFNQAMNSLIRDATENFIDRELPSQKRFYDRGHQAISRVQKRNKSIDSGAALKCTALFAG